MGIACLIYVPATWLAYSRVKRTVGKLNFLSPTTKLGRNGFG